MAITELWDADAGEVMDYLANWEGSNANLPSNTKITNKWLPRSSARLQKALLDAGYSVTDASDDTNYPIAYELCREKVELGAALMYVKSVRGQNFGEDEDLRLEWESWEEWMEDIGNGMSLGDLTITEGKQTGKFYTAGASESDLDDTRVTYTEEN